MWQDIIALQIQKMDPQFTDVWRQGIHPSPAQSILNRGDPSLQNHATQSRSSALIDTVSEFTKFGKS